jgi:hypothetical protein
MALCAYGVTYLVELAYLSKERITLALLDAHGRDVDVMEICRPLVNRTAGTMRY